MKTVESLFDEEEFFRWMRQAEHTLASAQRDAAEDDYAWACFKAQQAAEYATKALLRGLGLPAFGHSVLGLVGEIEKQGLPITEDIRLCARTLDRHYIPPRYPDAYPAGSPFEFYDRKTAEEAISCAQAVLQAVQKAKELCA
jgi:HEPN domain-containing protein